MRKIETRRKQLGGGAALFGGLVIAALAFSAGAVGARSHKAEAPVVRTQASSLSTATDATEPRWINPSDQDHPERQVPGHSELDLQLD